MNSLNKLYLSETRSDIGKEGRVGRLSGPDADLFNLFSNLNHVATRKFFQVIWQSAGLDDTIVHGLVEWLSEENIVTQSGILDPGLLGDVGH